MSGWNLSEGLLEKEFVSQTEFWEIINNIFSTKTNKTTTYKYAFFKSIIDNIFNIQNNKIKYEVLFERFAEIYWNIVSKHKLIQIYATSRFAKSSVEIIIEKIINEYNIDNSTLFEVLREDIKSKYVKEIIKDGSKYVVGAFYEDTNHIFYGFNKRLKEIYFNESVVNYIIKFKNILTKLNYFEWIKFLEKTNNNTEGLSEKLDYLTKRTNLNYYRDYLFRALNSHNCFYCGVSLQNKKVEVDHFIPWSYIKDDKIWNLVLSCRTCNNNKRDKLPNRRFINKLVLQNKIILSGEYYNELKKEYIAYDDNKVKKIYNSAVFNGFNNNWSIKGE